MNELHAPRVQTQGRSTKCECLRRAKLIAAEIRAITTDGQTKIRAMDADLIRAPRERTRFEKSRAVIVATDDTEFRARFQSVIVVHRARTQLAGLRADGRIATERVVRRLALHKREINFPYVAARELRLKLPGEVSRACDKQYTGRVRIQSVRGKWSLRVINFVENMLERVTIKSPASVHRQGCGFVQHD